MVVCVFVIERQEDSKREEERGRQTERDRDGQETRHAGFYSMCVLGLPRGQTIKEHLKR